MKRNIILSVFLGLMILLGISVSYSMWIMTNSQDNVNAIETTNKCFNVELTSESDNIKLENAYPITDEAGSKLNPYSFKITNTCEWNAYYKLNLETLSSSTIDNKFIKASLDNSNPKVINNYMETDTSLKDSKAANTLKSGYLPVGGSVSFDLRLWMDYETTIDDIKNDGTDKWAGKIVVVSSLAEDKGILAACQNKGGDLIDEGECRKYYVKLNNLVNLEDVKFGNEADGKKINHTYNSDTKTWTISYQGSNKWFGFLIDDVNSKAKHTFYGTFYSSYRGHGSTTEVYYYLNENSQKIVGYLSLNPKRTDDFYTYYFNLEDELNAKNIYATSYDDWYLHYFGYGYSENISPTYVMSKYKLVDLTLMFGDGNEPDREWCDKYLKDYFEYNASGTLMPIKEIGSPVKTSYYDTIDIFD